MTILREIDVFIMENASLEKSPKNIVLFVFHLIIPLVLYLCYYCLLGQDSMLFIWDVSFFISLLLVYFLIQVLSITLLKKIGFLLQIISNSLFIVCTIVQCYYYVSIFDDFYSSFVFLFPMLLPFLIWLYCDVSKYLNERIDKSTFIDVKKKRIRNLFFLFLRFLYMVVVYCCLFMPPEPSSLAFFLLDYRVFFSFLAVYFTFAIIVLFISEKKFVKTKYAFDLLFVLLFSIMTLIVFYSGLNSSDGAGFLVIFIIFEYFPVYIPFIIWLERDVKLLKKFQTDNNYL